MAKEKQNHTFMRIILVAGGLLLSSSKVRQKIIDEFDHVRKRMPGSKSN
ncbi:hypothetical protein [Weissella oryzae]|nr:hypothetical protein [Weissella oryzae]